jgi:hypothetical protein
VKATFYYCVTCGIRVDAERIDCDAKCEDCRSGAKAPKIRRGDSAAIPYGKFLAQLRSGTLTPPPTRRATT